MGRKKKIDFIIRENEYNKLVFRFYPRQSHCHGFGDEPPKSWDAVYKVYYSYSIIEYYKDGWSQPITKFKCCFDECSIIDDIAIRCDWLSKGFENSIRTIDSNGNLNEEEVELLNTEVRSFGMGVCWKISKSSDGYIFTLFDWDGVGYRFFLNEDKMKSFGEYLLGCCDYMLEHSEPI